jgi:hypothetical protein
MLVCCCFHAESGNCVPICLRIMIVSISLYVTWLMSSRSSKLATYCTVNPRGQSETRQSQKPKGLRNAQEPHSRCRLPVNNVTCDCKD